MSLTDALRASTQALLHYQNNIGVSSSNINNADKAGYTRKTYQTDYITTNGTTLPLNGTSVREVNEKLYAKLLDATSSATFDSTTTDFLTQLAESLGQTDGTGTISAALNDFMRALSALTADPEGSSGKITVVAAAEALAQSISDQSDEIQSLRSDADKQIASTVQSANDILKKLEGLNENIADAKTRGQSTADMEDDRATALQQLSQYMEIDSFYTTDGQLRIYGAGGALLLGTEAQQLSYTPANFISSETTYPDDLSGVTVQGKDVTTAIKGGTLGGVIQLRDKTLVDEQTKLDTIAKNLASAVNDILNKGASLPARSSITSDVKGLNATDSLSGTGSFRVALVNASGAIQSSTDIDLSTISTMGDLVTALNGISGISASLDADGTLVITSNDSSLGIAFDNLDSNIGGSGKSLSGFFGLNNLFTYNAANPAQSFSVSAYLSDHPDYLATGKLGSSGISAGDSSVTQAVSDALSASRISNSITGWSAAIAVSASSASTASGVSSSAQSALQQKIDGLYGVNIDEETANIAILQNAYEASASVISTLQDMFDKLLEAVR